MQDGNLNDSTVWFKANEAAGYLNLQRGSFYNLVHEGRIPFYRLLGGRTLRFRKSDMARLLKPGND